MNVDVCPHPLEREGRTKASVQIYRMRRALREPCDLVMLVRRERLRALVVVEEAQWLAIARLLQRTRCIAVRGLGARLGWRDWDVRGDCDDQRLQFGIVGRC